MNTISMELVIGWSELNSARSLAAFSFAASGVSLAAAGALVLAVLVSGTVGLAGGATLVSSGLTAGANQAKTPRQPAANILRAAEKFGLFTKQCLTAQARGEKRNLRLAGLAGLLAGSESPHAGSHRLVGFMNRPAVAGLPELRERRRLRLAAVAAVGGYHLSCAGKYSAIKSS